MAKITYRGLAPPDHPVYCGGAEMFSPRAFRPHRRAENEAPVELGVIPGTPPSFEEAEAKERAKRELMDEMAKRMRAGFRAQAGLPDRDLS